MSIIPTSETWTVRTREDGDEQTFSVHDTLSMHATVMRALQAKMVVTINGRRVILDHNNSYRWAPDSTTLFDAHQLISVLGTDARKWAASFIEHAQKAMMDKGLTAEEILTDEDYIFGWFANAIERAKS